MRLYKFDNIKFILIFLVVFGHLLEHINIHGVGYKCIYLFHMPAFVFVSGIFASFRPKNIFCTQIIPYLIFNLFYAFVSNMSLTKYSIAQPVWLMWYMLSLIIWTIVLPLFQTNNAKRACWMLLLTFIISLFLGFDHGINRHLSLGRTVALFPFFLAGHYYKHMNPTIISILTAHKRKAILIPCLVLLIQFCSVFIFNSSIHPAKLYFADPYSTISDLWIRLFQYIASVPLVLLLMLIVPNKQIPWITTMGQGTLCIYLCHGIILRAFSPLSHLKHLDPAGGYVLAFLMAFAFVAIFGNKYVSQKFNKCIKLKWINWNKNYISSTNE